MEDSLLVKDLLWDLNSRDLGWLLLAPADTPATTVRLGRLRDRLGRLRGRSWSREAADIGTVGWVGSSSHHIEDAALRASVQDRLRPAGPALLRSLNHTDRLVRRAAAYTIQAVPFTDEVFHEALRARAAVEREPVTLAALIEALDVLGVPAPRASYASVVRAAPGAWFEPWLSHRSPIVRLTALAAYARHNPPQDDRIDVAEAAVADLHLRIRPQLPRLRLPGMEQGIPPRQRPHVMELVQRFADRPEQGLRIAVAAFYAPDAAVRVEAPAAAAVILAARRTGVEALWHGLGASLDAEDTQEGWPDAATLLAAGANPPPGGTSPAAPSAGGLRRIVGLERGYPHQHTAADAAVALALLQDPAAVAAVQRWLGPEQPNFGQHREFRAAVAALTEPAVVFLAPLCAVLRRTAAEFGQGAVADFLAAEAVPSYLEVLAAWGPASAPAVPDLVALLRTGHVTAACDVLGAIGPAAADAAGPLERLVTAAPGGAAAAWAYWRITGDPGPAVEAVGRSVIDLPGRDDLARLADLGPLAAAYTGDLRRLLDLEPDLSEADAALLRIEAAHAWWCVTGDPGPALAVLLDALRPLHDNRCSTVVRRAVRHLGALGPAASAAAPLLHDVVTADHRYLDVAAGVRSRPAYVTREALIIRWDVKLAAGAATALDRITGPG